MKLIVTILLSLLVAQPTMAGEYIYKWKDKTGEVRYSDTPPPNQIKPISVTKKTTKSSTLSADGVNSEVPANGQKPAPAAEKANSADEAAALRRKNEEVAKRNKAEKENQEKLNAENCKAARSNLASYTTGGRIYQTNEKGEREYLDDKGLDEGKAKAQAEVNQYCK